MYIQLLNITRYLFKIVQCITFLVCQIIQLRIHFEIFNDKKETKDASIKNYQDKSGLGVP